MFPRHLVAQYAADYIVLAIHSVTVGSHQTEFTQHDPLANITISGSNDPQDCHNHPELKRKLYSALAEGDEGELSIAIPKEVPLKQSDHSSSGVIFSEGKPLSRLP
jgi:transcription initiation factor TFIID subunit 2